LNGANANAVLFLLYCLAKKENGKKNATRDVKPGNVEPTAIYKSSFLWYTLVELFY
jgi:hypothetical protein